MPSVPYAPSGEPNREDLVVYYSGSGHSDPLAREIALAFNAPSLESTPTTRRIGRSPVDINGLASPPPPGPST